MRPVLPRESSRRGLRDGVGELGLHQRAQPPMLTSRRYLRR